jgi:hypothetical protein
LHKKWVSYLYRTAQPFTLATFLSWGSSIGAGRIRLTRMQKYSFLYSKKHLIEFSMFISKFLIFAVNQTKTINFMETKNSLFSSALKTGLIIGVVSIVVFLIMYVADIKPVGILVPILILLLSIAISIVVLVIYFKKYRASIGGFISFRDAFLYCFIALAVSVVIYQFFNYLFILIVDPEYYKNIMEAQKTWMENYLAGKMSDEQLTEQLNKLDEQAAKMGTFSALIKNLLGSVIVSGIIALIIGAIMKKNPEVFGDNSGGTI